MILYETSRIENFSISLLLSRGCSAVIGNLYTALPSLRDYDLKMRNFTISLRRRRQGERQKSNKFKEQNNNSARASRCFVHFGAVPARTTT